jgi:RNA polymerase sigma-70 factor (ECF subfamily)
MDVQDKPVEFSLAALKAGDRDEFVRLIDEYSGRIYGLALKILRDENDAEDVLQETFLKAFRALPTFEGRSSISTWLYRIATNEALMLVRKRKPELDGTIDNPDDTELDEPLEIVDWCCLPEAELLSSEARRHLDQAVEELSPNLRLVFIMRDIHGLSTRQTAEVLNISEVAVKTRLLRARLQLREMLSVYYRERMLGKKEDE